MATNFVFKNRQSEFPNRRKLTIVEQQGNELLDIVSNLQKTEKEFCIVARNCP